MSENLLELAKKGESEEVELKKSTAQLERALKSVCSFSNHKGGRVYFGINKGIIVGQEVSEQTLKSISQKIRQRIKTEVTPEVKVLEIEGKRIIEVIISEGANKPYYLNGIGYKRVGTEDVVIPPEELEKLILEKKKGYWDKQTCEGATLEDIDWGFVKEDFIPLYEKTSKKIIDYIKKNGRITTSECASLLKVSNDTSLRELSLLRSLGLIDKKGVGRGTYYVIK